MTLFWNEQQNYIKASSPCSVKYHPMIIKFCLNLAAKSSSAYSDLRFDSKTGSGVFSSSKFTHLERLQKLYTSFKRF